jgi:peroxiredoxin
MAIPFNRHTVDGKLIRFPQDYRGKLVLLYFWADWCPDCAKEIPNVRQAYDTFHARGLEIVGLSIEPDNQQKKLVDFVQDNKMPWPQTYDGKLWLGKMAQTYFILTTPTGFLVDGDTGKILATRNDLLGPALSKTIEKALADKKR